MKNNLIKKTSRFLFIFEGKSLKPEAADDQFKAFTNKLQNSSHQRMILVILIVMQVTHATPYQKIKHKKF